jgi:hypothetical protein
VGEVIWVGFEGKEAYIPVGKLEGNGGRRAVPLVCLKDLCWLSTIEGDAFRFRRVIVDGTILGCWHGTRIGEARVTLEYALYHDVE